MLTLPDLVILARPIEELFQELGLEIMNFESYEDLQPDFNIHVDGPPNMVSMGILKIRIVVKYYATVYHLYYEYDMCKSTSLNSLHTTWYIERAYGVPDYLKMLIKTAVNTNYRGLATTIADFIGLIKNTQSKVVE